MDYQQKLDLALQRIAHRYPFHAGIINQWVILCDDCVSTMGIGMSEGHLTLHYDKKFVEQLPLLQLQAVLLHEINHFIFRHLELNRDEFEDEEALVAAMEVTVNEYIAEPLPENAILLNQYPILLPGEDTVSRYKKLKGKIKTLSQPLDNHGLWEDMSSPAKKNILSSMLIKAQENLSAIDMQKIPEWLKKKLSELEDKTQGFCSGNNALEIQTQQSKISWQNLLKKYVGSILGQSPTFLFPPRRFPELIGIFPGWRYVQSRPKIMAVIDTSGSMSKKELEQINGELQKMAKVFSVVVVECDTEIQAVYRYKKIAKIHGRGGTSFIPPLRREFLKQIKPDMVIYFTDAQGLYPEKAPAIPIIWCITDNGKCPVTWGKKIVMKK